MMNNMILIIKFYLVMVKSYITHNGLYEYEYEYEWCLLCYSLRRTSLNDKPLPYVKVLYSVTPY